MSIHQDLVDATFRVVIGNSCGSGFSLIYENTVITNCHVIAPYLDESSMTVSEPIMLYADNRRGTPGRVVYVDGPNDFAIIKTEISLHGRKALNPETSFTAERGKKVIFSGSPEGIDRILTSEGIISGPFERGAFWIDGMVNGGNSGGPVIDAESGLVIGIATAKRYLYQDEDANIRSEIEKLRRGLRQFSSSGGGVQIMGVDFAGMADLFSRSLSLISKMSSSNSNAGIGLGFPIHPVLDAIERLQCIP